MYACVWCVRVRLVLVRWSNKKRKKKARQAFPCFLPASRSSRTRHGLLGHLHTTHTTHTCTGRLRLCHCRSPRPESSFSRQARPSPISSPALLPSSSPPHVAPPPQHKRTGIRNVCSFSVVLRHLLVFVSLAPSLRLRHARSFLLGPLHRRSASSPCLLFHFLLHIIMPLWFNRPRTRTGGNGTGTAPMHPPTPIHRLSVREKLELSPWAKWSLYGYFPWKMSLHVTLVVLITVQATLVNMHYAAYSRAVGRSFVNLFSPPSHTSPDVSEFTYHIFDVRDTITDAHRLLETYFRLPELSVDAVKVATPNPPFPFSYTPPPPPPPPQQKHHDPIRLPQITLSYHNPTKPPDVFLLPNASAPWPFQVNGTVQQWLEGANGGLPAMRSFLDDLKMIDFDFRVRSKGWGGGVDRNREVCVLWSLGFVYDLSVGGQFSVWMEYRPAARCSARGMKDRYAVLCVLIGLVSAVYQLLLFRSGWQRFKILRYLKRRTETPSQSQHGPGPQAGGEGGREEEDRPRHPSAFSSPANSSGEREEEEGEEGKEEVEGERLPLLASGATAVRRSSAAGGEGGGGGGGGEGGGYQSMAPSHRPHLSSSSTPPSSSTPSSQIILLPPPARPTPPLRSSLAPLLITATTTSSPLLTLTWSDKLELFGLWPTVALLGNLCALTYTLESLSSHTHVDIFVNPSSRLWLGLACLMLWLALIQYLEFEARYYVMILTLKRAVPRIGQFLLGIAPMFLGYALLGMILFGDQNPLFGSLLRTVGTLFCVVNGDSIKVVLDSLGGSGVGVLYVVLYMMLFTYVVLMTCIAIVEEAFFSSAEYAHNLWVGEEEGEGEGGKEGGGKGGKGQMFAPYENGAGREQQQQWGSYSSYHSAPPSHHHEQQQQQQQQQHDDIPVLSMAGVSYTSLSTSSAISASSSSSHPPSPPHYPTTSSSSTPTSSSLLPNPPGLRSRQNSTGSVSGAFDPVLLSSSPLPPPTLPPPPSSYLPSRLTTPAPSPLNTGSSIHATPRPSSSSSPALLPSLLPPPPLLLLPLLGKG